MPASTWRGWLAAVLLAGLACAHAATQVSSGQLPDGTPYRIDFPDNWNGTLLVSLDYAPDGGTQAAQVELQRRGFATSGMTRGVTGWSVGDAIDNHLRVHALFTQRHGRPLQTYVNGRSLGGHTGAALLQARPDVFDGGILQCAGLAGLVGQWNAKLDGLFVAQTLLAPGDARYPVIDVPGDFATGARPAWLALLKEAQHTPEGRARIALAAVMAQLPAWSVEARPIPAPGDVDALQEGLYDSLAGNALPSVGQMMSSRHEINRRSGGHVSWNLGVDYEALLARAEHADVVRALYARAGLGLEADLARLRAAPRFAATPDAIRWARVQVISRPLTVPVITLTGIGDNISPTAAQQAYEAAAGSEHLRQTYVRSAGHCSFNGPETVAAVETLHLRVRSGRWPDTRAAAMNARAAAVPLEGTPRFVEHVPHDFMRPFRFFSLLPKGQGTVAVRRGQADIEVVLASPEPAGSEHGVTQIDLRSLRLGAVAPASARFVAGRLVLRFGLSALPRVARGNSLRLPLTGHYVHGVPIDETIVLRTR